MTEDKKQDIERGSFQFGKRAGSPLEVLINESIEPGLNRVHNIKVQRYALGISYQEIRGMLNGHCYQEYDCKRLFYWQRQEDGSFALFLDYDAPGEETRGVGSTAGFFSTRTELIPDKGTKVMGFYPSIPYKLAIQEVNSHITRIYADAEQNRKGHLKCMRETNADIKSGWGKELFDKYTSLDYSSPPQVAEDIFEVLKDLYLPSAVEPSDSEARR